MQPTFISTILLFILALGIDGKAEEFTTSRRTAVVRAVEQVQPSVVSIYVTYRERVTRYYRGDPFLHFFSPYVAVPGERERTFGGSGLIVSADGYILTNDHVIRTPQGPYRIAVLLPDDQSFEADYIGSDLAFDLAILKIETTDLPVAPLGNSDDILVGEWAVAIGNPFGLGGTVSAGVISAVNREIPASREDYLYRDMIQTDASINQGNSGGPLVNALGEIIGINSVIYTESAQSIGSIGIGFAIPINTAHRFLEEIRQHGKIRMPWIGLSLQDITRPLAEYLELPTTDGVMVVKVQAESPAYVAGLEKGDVIIEISGEKISNRQEAIAALQGFRVDDQCNLKIVRGGKTQYLPLHFTEQPPAQQRRF